MVAHVMTLMDDEELGNLTATLATMDEDQRLSALVNSVLQSSNGSPTYAMRSLANLMVTISCMLDTPTKLRCIETLREAAQLFEDSLQTTNEATTTLN